MSLSFHALDHEVFINVMINGSQPYSEVKKNHSFSGEGAESHISMWLFHFLMYTAAAAVFNCVAAYATLDIDGVSDLLSPSVLHYIYRLWLPLRLDTERIGQAEYREFAK